MSREQYYKLVKGFKNDDWPLYADDDTIRNLNRISPPGYYYHLVSSHDDDGNIVELYEYAGEMDTENESEVFD